MKYQIAVNGKLRHVEAEPDTPLLWVLRDELRLTGTKYGCGVAQCGACTVHLDGRTVRACVMPISAVGENEVTTIEGVSGRVADAVQKAWIDLQVPQCGYCQSGQVMTTIALLDEIPEPDDAAINAALTGNICRCVTYTRIRRAVRQAAATAARRRS